MLSRRRIIEWGLYFLLFFTPLAFGSVEMWALGLFQIVAGIVFVAWAWRFVHRRRLQPSGAEPRRFKAALWVPIGLFVLLVLFQLLPLPRDWIRRLSPGTDQLYSRTLPGYAAGEEIDTVELVPWLLADMEERVPITVEPTQESENLLRPPLATAGFPTRSSPWRTISVYPLQTRQRLTYFLCLVALFAVVLDHFRSRRQIYVLLSVMVWSGFLISLFGILQKFSFNGKIFWVRETIQENFFGPFVNRNSYAAFVGTILPLALCFCLSAFRELRADQEEDVTPRFVFFGFATVIIGGSIFYSLSRGGMISTGLSLFLVAIFLVWHGRRGVELAVLAVLLAAAVGLVVWLGAEPVVERMETLSEGLSEPSLAGRLMAWRHTVDMIKDHLWLGTGLGTFRFAFLRYGPPGRAWWTTAHNEYIELLCDTGLLGGLLLLVGAAVYTTIVLRPGTFKADAGPYVYTGMVAGLGALLFHSAVSSNLQLPANGLLLAVMGAALLSLTMRQNAALKNRARSREADRRRA